MRPGNIAGFIVGLVAVALLVASCITKWLTVDGRNSSLKINYYLTRYGVEYFGDEEV
ncbi:hypothetical protein DFA_06045 [Cavenderia fasciculata]|uniref:Transmembrane protein n=1 Tax=Cavenderia fasciculata TaxID=261658 RepID=F4PJY3_CACFS|nr:uncharacterized protein DFA_06045 [Cavenderia fasciculata]EGG23907.1 hypothetical protein DFA_06045 [Cavenderia fasciculata]|eukprot:XP_004361758.1 hypothetical protein DFA_06045 [Cavenderia fasciculata]